MIKNILLSAVLSLAVMPSASSAWAEDVTHIRIATEGAYAPWNYTLPDGSLAGYEIDLAKELCRRMKAECEIVGQDWDGMLPALNAGKFDAIIASMGVTPDRQKVAAFSDPYSRAPNAFMAMKESGLDKVVPAREDFNLRTNPDGSKKVVENLAASLKGKVLGVQGSTTAGLFADAYLKDALTIRSYKTIDEMNLDLVAGRVDLVMANVTVLNAALAKPELSGAALVGPTFVEGVLGSGTTNVALRKSDTALKEKFNTAIHSVDSDGFNKALTEKWFGADISVKD
ncbi:transporter substrate-binding domain-containing protein [Mesorhizobium cantuariense]|uniref:Transporter substrate-binding domain-containing protein n=1 Tax=Mesorhizobium cantuariense TaxID=1300275 RepID=A0ABV7MHC9_9HYPH